MTEAELIVVLDRYFIPLYKILGAIAAAGVVAAAYYMVIVPFLRRV